ncbi:hypothetical protein [Membranihabitans marinus]|uniref:hypothetical protein n=1 Tax=Membranihabitans marinus TaxID=1227546 RepID=UPI001F44806E|nr:hypothetical protein [Membranihabitans marinus]
MKWSFNRLIDGNKINTETIEWNGPYSWPKYESVNGLPKIPDLEGVYLFTFEYKNNFVVYAAGITNSTKK